MTSTKNVASHQKEKKLEDLIANFEQSPLLTKPFKVPSISKYRKLRLQEKDCRIPNDKDTPNGYSTITTSDISKCEKCTTPVFDKFNDEQFEKDFNIEPFINIPTNERAFISCCGKLSYIINRHLLNKSLSDQRTIAEKELLAVYFIFTSLYVTDNILYPLDVLLQLYRYDTIYTAKLFFDPELNQSDIDNCKRFIELLLKGVKKNPPLLTIENITELLDTSEYVKKIGDEIEKLEKNYELHKQQLSAYIYNNNTLPIQQRRLRNLIAKEKIKLKVLKYDRQNPCNLNAKLYHALNFAYVYNPLHLKLQDEWGNNYLCDSIARYFTRMLKSMDHTDKNFKETSVSYLEAITKQYIFFCSNDYAINNKQWDCLSSAFESEFKFLKSLLGLKLQSISETLSKFKQSTDSAQSHQSKTELNEKMPDEILSKVIGKIYFEGGNEAAEKAEPSKYNFWAFPMDKYCYPTAPFDKNTYLSIMHFFGTYRIPFSISELKKALKKSCAITIAETHQSKIGNLESNKFFGNQKIYIIAFMHFAISRYINENRPSADAETLHLNRCLLFFHGCIIVALLRNYYLGEGRLNCFTEIHSKLSYFMLKELQYLNPPSIENLKPYLELGEMLSSTNYKGETTRIINNLTAFAHGYVICRCPYFEEHYNQTGQLYTGTNYDDIKKECGKSCCPCIFNHRLWPSSCDKLKTNQFRFVFNIPVSRRNLQNYFKPTPENLSNPTSKSLSNPIHIIRALEESTGVPSFCIDGIFSESENPTPNSIKERYTHITSSDTKYTYFPHEEWSIHIHELEVLNLYLYTVQTRDKLSLTDLTRRFEFITYFDENGHACVNYDKFFAIHYPPINSYFPLSDLSLCANISPWNCPKDELLSSSQFTITGDKFIGSCLSETEYASFREPEIAFETDEPLLTYEDCFINLKPIYYKGNSFEQLKCQLIEKYKTLGNSDFRAKIKNYYQEIIEEGYDVVVKDFALGIINGSYDFCFIRIAEALCKIFDIEITTKN